MIGTVDLVLIIAGVVVVLIAIGVIIACLLRSSRRWQIDAERAALLQNEGSTSEVLYSTQSSDWKFGELDYAGVKRIVVWLAEVRQACAKNGGIEPIVEETTVDSTLLGQQDDIGSPPQGYSPRVSAIGSDEDISRERYRGDGFLNRDPLKM